jgi:hypothetical protein
MSDTTILTLGGTICTALIGAIATLWRDQVQSKKNGEQREARAEERYLRCEERHNETRTDLLRVTEEVGQLKGTIHLASELGPKLDRLAERLENQTPPDRPA